jgi:hypothetical protein
MIVYVGWNKKNIHDNTQKQKKTKKTKTKPKLLS